MDKMVAVGHWGGIPDRGWGSRQGGVSVMWWDSSNVVEYQTQVGYQTEMVGYQIGMVGYQTRMVGFQTGMVEYQTGGGVPDAGGGILDAGDNMSDAVGVPDMG